MFICSEIKEVLTSHFEMLAFKNVQNNANISCGPFTQLPQMLISY